MEWLLKSGTIYELIAEQLAYLPAEKAHLEMIPYRTKESLEPSKNKLVKNSAVLCLCCITDSRLEILLMERTKDGSPHSGQISFPGGKVEKSDANLSDTALRETEEEVGINRDKIEMIGQLTPLYIPVSNFKVTPFIGFTDHLQGLSLSDKEVKSVFTITVADLLDQNKKTTKDIANHMGQVLKGIPCFLIGDKVIWGATALILNEVRIIFETIIQNQSKKNT